MAGATSVGAEHDHAITETELSMGYHPIGIGHDELLLKPERLVSPFD